MNKSGSQYYLMNMIDHKLMIMNLLDVKETINRIGLGERGLRERDRD